jgi:hypothetical protein
MAMRTIVLRHFFSLYIYANTVSYADAQHHEPSLGFQFCQRQLRDGELGYGFLWGKVTFFSRN